VRLSWRPAPYAHALATVALVALVAGIALRHPQALLVAAPLLGVLAAGQATGCPDEIEVAVTVSARRCFEGEDVEVRVAATSGTRLDRIALEFRPPGPMEITGEARQGRRSTTKAEGRWTLRPRRWGRHVLDGLRIEVRRGHRTARLEMSAGELGVFPHGPRTSPRLVPPDLLRRVGEHVGRAEGAGVEFAGIRPYVIGDRLRDINWKASGHRGRLHVTTRAAERQADVVVVIDARTDVGPPGESTLDTAMRGAASVATAYLRRGDRVGAVALGGHVHWLAPGMGETYFYRIAEAVLDVRRFHSELPPAIERVPRVALPPKALAVVFSPLLDEDVITVITDLRRRGHAVVVVDVLDDREPPIRSSSKLDALALRLWRLDRVAVRRGLSDLGVAVVRGELPDRVPS
jgi:uncharacterized protein (DUF58 family)